MQNVIYSTLTRIFSLLISLAFIFGFNENLIAQTKIEGEIDPMLNIDSFVISYTTNPIQENNIYAWGEEKEIQVTDGKFSFELDSMSAIFYILFNLPSIDYSESSAKYFLFSQNTFLLRSGTHTKFFISANEVRFVGEDEEILRCQLELFQINADLARERSRVGNKYDFNNRGDIDNIVDRYLTEYKGINNKAEIKSIELVETKYGHLELMIRNKILYNIIGDMRMSELKSLNFKSKEDHRITDQLYSFYVENYVKDVDSTLLNGYLGGAVLFSRYLSLKNTVDLSILSSKIDKRIHLNLAVLLDILSKKYQGRVYDEVAFSTFLDRSMSHNIDEKTYLNLLSTIDSVELRESIKDDLAKRKPYQKSFQFRLVDDKGEYISNSDFLGKVVLFDFWFTGCRGCAALHKKMIPVKEHFRNDPSVVFVSVCVDSDEELWKRSIRSGDYTDKDDVKLWIGRGDLKHPIIKHYRIASYPTMVLVNADDNLVMINPPTPNDEKSREELIYLIKQAL